MKSHIIYFSSFVARSPIYTHLAASLQGLTTIRAFGAEEILTKEFDNYQDAYTAAYFMFLTANRTFGFWLDFHCVIFTGLVTISILFIQNGKQTIESLAKNVIYCMLFTREKLKPSESGNSTCEPGQRRNFHCARISFREVF